MITLLCFSRLKADGQGCSVGVSHKVKATKLSHGGILAENYTHGDTLEDHYAFDKWTIAGDSAANPSITVGENISECEIPPFFKTA